jgi:DNA-binding transcriptional ArsR family regulator
MSMELMVKAMKVKVGNPLRKLVLLKLADNASDHGECWPSYQHIADQCEISKRSVMNHIDALCECGLVKKELRPGPKGNSSNVYRLDFSSAGDSLGRSANRSLPSAGDSPHSAGDSPGGSAGAAPRISHSFEPVNESVIEPKYNGSSDNDSEKYRSSKENYSNEFEQAWQAYPKRAGGNSKAAAWKAWRARIKDGVNTEAMLAGVNRYAGYVRATGSAGTQYVKQAATFFGPDRHFDEAWLVETPAVKVPSRQEQSRYEWYAKSDDGSAEVFINQSAIDRMNRGGYRP